jgi:hypothetical protein
MTEWLILTATLPTNPSALRVRVWRALKATGAGTLREGVYVLPSSATTAPALWGLERTITEAGAEAHMLVVTARHDAQEKSFRALFDRSDLFGELLQSVKEARLTIKKSTEVDLHKVLRGLEQQLRAIQAIDFFPGSETEKASSAFAALRREVELTLSPGEPAPSSANIGRQAVEDYQGKTWATRKRPGIDRLATAWLVHRFVDKSPKFIWFEDPKKCPKSALGYDFDGARFTHIDDMVTFEVMARTFELEDYPGIKRMCELVHYIDVGGIPVDEAPGIEAVVRGLQAQYSKDEDLLAAALVLFDSLHTEMRERQ